MFNKRLFLPFLFSCLLHAALIFLTYFDSSNRKSEQHSGVPLILTKVRIIQGLQEAKKSSVDLVVSESTTTSAHSSTPMDKHQTNPESTDQYPSIEDPSWGIRLPLAATTYHTSAELTKRPRALTNPELDPIEINKIVATGTLILKLWINESGDVDKVEIEQTDLPKLIAAVAADVFSKQRFKPGEINDQTVASIIRIEIRYNDDRLMVP